MAYREKVPERFGQLGRLCGLYFGCVACSRGTMIDQPECVRRWGTEGRVADVAKRFACSNCKAKRKSRKPGVYVEVVRNSYKTTSEQARETMGQVDALVYDIGRLEPRRQIE